MTITRAITCLLLLTAPLAASTDLRVEVEAIIREFSSIYGVDVIWEAERLPRCTWEIDFEALTEDQLPVLRDYLLVFDQEFRKYPPSFVAKSKLARVAFGQGLAIDGQLRSGLPDYVKETLYFDVIRANSGGESYRRHVIHHEFYHLIEEQWNGSPYFKDPAWSRLNAKGFGYGLGGARTRGNRAAILDHPRPGFVNRYAMAGLEEDKAEVWSVMFVDDEWQRISPWLESDAILREKVRYLERFAREQVAPMNDAFWVRLREAGAATAAIDGAR